MLLQRNNHPGRRFQRANGIQPIHFFPVGAFPWMNSTGKHSFFKHRKKTSFQGDGPPDPRFSFNYTILSPAKTKHFFNDREHRQEESYLSPGIPGCFLPFRGLNHGAGICFCLFIAALCTADHSGHFSDSSLPVQFPDSGLGSPFFHRF